jgi:glycosyltransferase involved in cell wall biosynthesis
MADGGAVDPAGAGVSVVIPTYNCERYIGQTLRSVLAQSHPPLEVLVVDDGSTDSTAAIVRSFGGAVRLIQQANSGVCAARNRGFDESRGEFVCFLDHDDYWFRWKLARQIEAFKVYPAAGVVYTGFVNWRSHGGDFPDPEELAVIAPSELIINHEYSGWIYHHLLLTCWALTSTAMLRREVFARIGGFDDQLPYAEDWDLWLRISRQHPFVKVEAMSTLYRQHPDQGNRKLRPIDYRTRLLEDASARWGLSSADGRTIERQRFKSRLARYHMEFGLQHLVNGGRLVAIRSFWRAWRHHPLRLRFPVLVAAACLGWRPRQTIEFDAERK